MDRYTVNFETHGPNTYTYPLCWINFRNDVESDNDFVSKNGGMYNALTVRLKSLGIQLVDNPNSYVILEFKSEADFLMFKLKWS